MRLLRHEAAEKVPALTRMRIYSTMAWDLYARGEYELANGYLAAGERVGCFVAVSGFLVHSVDRWAGRRLASADGKSGKVCLRNTGLVDARADLAIRRLRKLHVILESVRPDLQFQCLLDVLVARPKLIDREFPQDPESVSGSRFGNADENGQAHSAKPGNQENEKTTMGTSMAGHGPSHESQELLSSALQTLNPAHLSQPVDTEVSTSTDNGEQTVVTKYSGAALQNALSGLLPPRSDGRVNVLKAITVTQKGLGADDAPTTLEENAPDENAPEHDSPEHDSPLEAMLREAYKSAKLGGNRATRRRDARMKKASQRALLAPVIQSEQVCARTPATTASAGMDQHHLTDSAEGPTSANVGKAARKKTATAKEVPRAPQVEETGPIRIDDAVIQTQDANIPRTGDDEHSQTSTRGPKRDRTRPVMKKVVARNGTVVEVSEASLKAPSEAMTGIWCT